MRHCPRVTGTPLFFTVMVGAKITLVRGPLPPCWYPPPPPSPFASYLSFLLESIRRGVGGCLSSSGHKQSAHPPPFPGASTQGGVLGAITCHQSDPREGGLVGGSHSRLCSLGSPDPFSLFCCRHSSRLPATVVCVYGLEPVFSPRGSQILTLKNGLVVRIRFAFCAIPVPQTISVQPWVITGKLKP